ncbi:PASTA domain-containing protein [Kribbella sandramycini]|uniref:Membrane peptidoglycan carboxypeptidase n=1 Tax=Kribbella sandramycini TaxID=60450 RepID=A0A7Y4P3F5_9ACTN|nr:penicillin-binding protein [Kribbella sandramycini]MBB6566002.1 membrane peptidoglycan carboxypeptidase [Kribbella sandramycini]NOL45003.1 PASTA domain-containing protein [Kribbella sandramycini]
MRVREKGDRGVVQSVILFLGVSVLSGALAAGLAMPLAGLAGFTTEQTYKSIESLPQKFDEVTVKAKSTIRAADGSVIATLAEKYRTPVTLSQIAPIMQKAIVAIEDDRFYEHGALDLKGTLRALAVNQAEGSVQQGGSSITQQYIKMSLIEKATSVAEVQAATASTPQRKIAELRYAIAAEKQFSKNEILEKYLNLANFGDGAWGIQAAAQHYFRVDAKDLTLAQAAMLAGLVKSPTAYDPTNNMKKAKDRRDVVIRRMLELKVVSLNQANAALKAPVVNLNIVRKTKVGCANSPYPFYCEYVVAQLKDNPAFGKNEKERSDFLKTAGLTIRTSIDPKIQAAAQASIDQHSRANDQAIAAISMVEPGTGLVKAMVQSRPYGAKKNQTAYNYNVEKTYAGGFGGFQIGSTMKAFTVAAAIQKGFSINHKIASPDTIDLSGKKFSTCDGTTSAPKYTPSNSTKNVPVPTMVQAAQKSTNTYFLLLSQQVGLCSIAKLGASLGLNNAQTEEPLEQVPSMTLGVDYMTPLQLTAAYAAFAARGKFCNPWVVTSVRDANGKAVKIPGQSCKQVLAPEVADGVNEVLHQVMEPGGTGQALKFGNSDLAGKTGTIQKAKAVWYSGYSSSLAASAVVADASPPYETLAGQTLNGRGVNDASGSKTAGPLWETAMRAALKGKPTTKFTAPTDKTRRGDTKELPFINGMNPEDAANKLRQNGFEAAIDPTPVNSEEAAGTVAYTDPRRRDGAPEGSLVTIYVSNGSRGNNNGDNDEDGDENQPPNTTRPPGNGNGNGGGPNNTCPPWNPKYPNC